MPLVRLGRRELDEYDLPRVCLCCGEPASRYQKKEFRWHPPWVYAFILLGLAGLPLWVLFAFLLSKRMTVRAPLCERHKWHWAGRTLITLGVFLGLIAALCGGIAVLYALDLEEDKISLVVAGFALVLTAWVVLAVVLQLSGVRPAEITDRGITLTGVSERFADAVERAGDGDEDDEDEDDRPRRRAPAKDDGSYKRDDGRIWPPRRDDEDDR